MRLAIPILVLTTALAAQDNAPAIKTGPDVGARVPIFTATDHTGRQQTFDSLKGPSGLVLLFVRSADW